MLQIFGKNLFNLESGDFWPMIILTAGIVFEAIPYTTRRAPGMLIPGGILTVIGLLFFFEAATDFQFAAYTWPVYILAVSAGLFQFYLARKYRGVLLAGYIVGGVGTLALAITVLVALLEWVSFTVLLAAVLLAAGAALILAGVFRGKKAQA